MLNAAVIGLGRWGRTTTGRMQASQEIGIMRAVNLFPEKQGDYTAKYGVPVTGDYTAVLAGPDIGAVILNTPNNLHTAQIVQVAHAGKHVVCEKPVALKVADARRSRSAVTRADPRHESRTPL